MSNSGKKDLKVLFLASEAEPFAKVGGLGDYAGSLPRAISHVGESTDIYKNINIRVVIPFNRSIKLGSYEISITHVLPLNTSAKNAHGYVYEICHDGIIFYIVRRAGNSLGYDQVYSQNPEHDAKKFVFFSLASLALAKKINWQPDIIHANDWHTALALDKLARIRKNHAFFQNTKGLLVIHNLPFMGHGSQDALKEFGIPLLNCKQLPNWAQNLPLPIGMVAADQILTVSPTYAEELKSVEFGNGLAEYFSSQSERFGGILNGIDTKIWDPESDPYIFHQYKSENLQPRDRNKLDLLQSVGLEDNIDIPLFVMVSRLTHQKGIDIILQSLPRLMESNWAGIILGSGDRVYEEGLQNLARIYPNRLKIILDYNAAFAHTLYAGGDFFLMPSLYEPCGLSQMIAMRYGCIPIASRVGGLKDSIISQEFSEQTGYLFDPAIESGFLETFNQALNDYTKKEYWRALQKKAMEMNFSWDESAKKYIELYCRMIEQSQ